MRRLKSLRTSGVICLRKAPKLPLVGYRLGVSNRVNVCRCSSQRTCPISPNCSVAHHSGSLWNFMHMATNCHRSAVPLCLRGSMTHGAGTIGAKRFEPSSCSSDTRGGGALSSVVGQTTHLHLFLRLRMHGFYLHFHMRLFWHVS